MRQLQGHLSLVQEELWGGIREAATECTQLMANKLIAQPKVCKFDIQLGIEKCILCFQVPVADAPLVAVMYS